MNDNAANDTKTRSTALMNDMGALGEESGLPPEEVATAALVVLARALAQGVPSIGELYMRTQRACDALQKGARAAHEELERRRGAH